MSHNSASILPIAQNRGRPLRFLAIIALVWIAGRLIANDAFDLSVSRTQWEEIQSPLWSDKWSHKSWQPYTPQTSLSALPAIAHASATSHLPDIQAEARSPVAGWEQVEQRTAIYSRLINSIVHSPQLSARVITPNGQDQMPQGRHSPLDSLGLVPFSKNDHSSADRWALNAWAFIRGDGSAEILPGRGRYGGSQVGATLSYRLGNGSSSRLYTRASHALSSPDQTAIAFGGAIRPIKSLPVDLHVEQQIALSDSASSRPAAFAVIAPSAKPLPLSAQATGYAQLGVTGGDDPLYFFDLSVIAQKHVGDIDKASVHVGGGLWSGGQGPVDSAAIADIARLDIGPQIHVNVPAGDARFNVALDWRQRVAGNADPGSGVALTVSTAF